MNTPSLATQVAQRVQAGMEAAGVSQVRLSEATGIARPTLIRRLQGHTAFTVNEMALIALALRCSVLDLLPEQEVA